MMNPDFLIKILVLVLGFPVFAGSIKWLMGKKQLTGENIFWLVVAYYFIIIEILFK